MLTFEDANEITHSRLVQFGPQLSEFGVVKVGIAHSSKIGKFHIARRGRIRRKSGCVGNNSGPAITAGERTAGCDASPAGHSRQVATVHVNSKSFLRLLPHPTARSSPPANRPVLPVFQPANY